MLDHVLKYKQFQWFIRADDDVYIHMDRLDRFLAQLDPTQRHLIGQAGLGRGTEFKRLAFAENENFCMGGPGIVFSRATLLQLQYHLDECVQMFASTHEDVEVTRCIRAYASLNCTWNFEMQRLLYHNYSGPISFFDSQASDLPSKLKTPLPNVDLNSLNLPTNVLNEAITLHPIKHPRRMLYVHEHFLIEKVKQIKRERWKLREKLMSLVAPVQKESNGTSQTDLWSATLEDDQTREPINMDMSIDSGWTNYELVQLSAFSEKRVTPQRKLESQTKRFLHQTFIQLMYELNREARPFRMELDWHAFDYALIRQHISTGVDIWLRAKVHVKQFGANSFHRFEWRLFHIRLPYDDPDVNIDFQIQVPRFEWSRFEMSAMNDTNNENPSSSLSTTIKSIPFAIIHMIVPLSGRYEVFERFMHHFQNLIDSDRHVRLIVILFPDEGRDNAALQNDYLRTKQLLVHTQKHVSSIRPRLHLKTIRWIEKSGHFSRAAALQSAAEQLTPESLLFFVDVDMLLHKNVLDRVRLNTRLGESAYFPIVFSEYSAEFSDQQTGPVRHSINDSNLSIDLRPQIGYWRQFGFGIASLYKADLDAVGGFNLNILGWGKEDVELFAAFVRRANFQVIRCPDPQLLHVHHEIHCKRNLDSSQFQMCLGTKYSSLGEQSRLVERILQHNLIV